MSGREREQSAASPRLSSAPIAVSIRVRQRYQALDGILTTRDGVRPTAHPRWAWRPRTDAATNGGLGSTELPSQQADNHIAVTRAERAPGLSRKTPCDRFVRS